MKKFGHRGGKALGTENSIKAMMTSMLADASGIEIDVQPARDGTPIVMHDSTIDRMTQGSGDVMNMSAELIHDMELDNGEHVPRLIDVLDALEREKPTIFIELKHPQVALPTAKIVHHYIETRGYSRNQLIVVSSLHQLLVQTHKAHSQIITGAILKEKTESLAVCGEYTHSQFLLPDINILDEDIMRDASERNLYVVPWVCDSKEQQEKAERLGAYGMILSDPSK